MNKGKVKSILIVVIFSLVVLVLFKTGAIEYLKDREKMKTFIEGFGPFGPLVYMVSYCLVTITGISALPLTILSGLIFGPILGILYTAIGASAGLSLAFLIARYVARDAIEKKFGNLEVFKSIQNGVERDGWFILATTRLLPIFPFGIQNYVYGLTSINFLLYSVLSTVFILPGTSVYVLLAGAIASGDTGKATKLALIASLIFFGITLITKVISKRSSISNEK